MAKQLPQETKFSKCPVCGSTDRLVGRLAQSAKNKGLAREDWECYMQGLQGVVVDPMKQHQLLIGTSMPAYKVYTDICMKCGTMYASKVIITSAVASPAKQNLPAGLASAGIIRGN